MTKRKKNKGASRIEQQEYRVFAQYELAVEELSEPLERMYRRILKHQQNGGTEFPEEIRFVEVESPANFVRDLGVPVDEFGPPFYIIDCCYTDGTFRDRIFVVDSDWRLLDSYHEVVMDPATAVL